MALLNPLSYLELELEKDLNNLEHVGSEEVLAIC